MKKLRTAGARVALAVLTAGIAATAHGQSTTASQKMTPGVVAWFDLLTEDGAAVLDFYRELFGWEIVRHDDTRWVVVHKGRPMAGISQIPNEDAAVSEAFWLAGIVVEDVDDAVERAKKNGAQVHIEPRDAAGYARIAVITDPEDVPVMLLDPFQSLGGVKGNGAWVWAELWTRDPGQAAKFYAKVVGFQRDTTKIGAAPYEAFTTGGEFRAGLVKTPDPKVEPAWAPYILVDDLEASLAQVSDLGGSIFVKPTDFRSRGSVALVADPGGAAFFLYQRNDTEQ
jgi:predicted enzyme related to lactoylglutathione lyase